MESGRMVREICALREHAPITFAHLSTQSGPEEHSLHVNDHAVELYVYVSGDVHYVIEDRYYVLEKYDFLLIPPHSTHAPVIKKRGKYERFYLLLPPDVFGAYADAPLERLLQLTAGERRIFLPTDVRERAMALLYRMSELSCGEDDGLLTLRLHALLLELLCLLCAGSANAATSAEAAAVPPLIRDTLAYIAKNATEIEHVASLAAHFYVSAPYLCSLFKKHVGVTVNDYLRAKKISAAKAHLSAGRSVTYTCYECGFNDTSYFIKVFRRYVGMTPRQYRERHGE
ncbi:MAG: helix-turn-helix domain-containing protein [Clostridia bacterium]|nr:helix-turn-helix domain-containing protein [Clostridia bacterium]